MRSKVSFRQACMIIKDGGVVAIPTETVYGLAGDIRCIDAIKKIFQIKKRPLFDPLIVHFSNKTQLKKLCSYQDSIVEKLSDCFHPGPLTLVLRKKPIVSHLITAGSSKVAVRMPQHPLTLQLMEQTNTCLAAPSANLFSKISPTRVEHILESLNVPVLDGGCCRIGIESSIVEVDGNKKKLNIFRRGIISKTDLEKFLLSNGYKQWSVFYQKESSQPGHFRKHYQPNVPLVIIEPKDSNVSLQEIQEKVKNDYPDGNRVELKLNNDPLICARELYHQLREFSKISDLSIIYVIKKPEIISQNQEAWLSIWDRLQKASSNTYQL